MGVTAVVIISTAPSLRVTNQVGVVRGGGGGEAQSRLQNKRTGGGGQLNYSYQSEWLIRGHPCHRAWGLQKASLDHGKRELDRLWNWRFF